MSKKRLLVLFFSGIIIGAGCDGDKKQPTKTVTSTDHLAGTKITADVFPKYLDGRSYASFRLPVIDYGVIIQHGAAPGSLDKQGARDPFVFFHNGAYYLHYDGASGNKSWSIVEATSTDLLSWKIQGNIIPLGSPGELDANCICWGVTLFDGAQYLMYYTGSNKQTPSPEIIPLAPYTTLKAHSQTLKGPWIKDGPPFLPQPGTYYSDTASPGAVVKDGGEFLMFFAAAQNIEGKMMRTIGVASAPSMSGSWKVRPSPSLPSAEQIENASLYFQQSTGQWFMFVNHIGLSPDGTRELADAIWVYWSNDLNNWSPLNKAVVIDGTASKWSKAAIGLPSIIEKDGKLAVFYDGSATATNLPTLSDNLNRDIALAWIQLPIKTP